MTYSKSVRVAHNKIRQDLSIHVYYRDDVTIVSRVLTCVSGVSDERI